MKVAILDDYFDTLRGLDCFGLLDGGIVSTQGLLHVGAGGLVKGTAQGDHVRIDGRILHAMQGRRPLVARLARENV